MNKIAIYLRLSMEDADDKDESNSISSQRVLIRKYIENHEEHVYYKQQTLPTTT